MSNVQIKASDYNMFVDKVNKLSTNSKITINQLTNKEKHDKIASDTINLLKNSINILEESFSNNCCQSQNVNCCQSCQSSGCQSCQKTTCQSCQTQCINCVSPNTH